MWTVNLQVFQPDLEKAEEPNCQHLLDHQKNNRVPEKHLLLLYWLCQSFWLCESQQTVENSSRDGITRPPHLTHWKRLWCWEGLGAGGEGDDRGWDGWMASLTRWTRVWVNSGRWWWGQGCLACCNSWGRKESDTTERLNWTELNWNLNVLL